MAYDAQSNQHTIKYADDEAQINVNLKHVSWNIFNARGAPGADPERQGACRALESSDEEDLLEVSGSPTTIWGTSACLASHNA